MCVAVPGRIVWVGLRGEATIPAEAAFGDEHLTIDLILTPDATVGDYVVTHSGYALRVVDAAEAAEILGDRDRP